MSVLRVGGWLQVRKLAAEVYGAHEQNGEWNDEGEWHVVGDEDLESSDNDLLGSDVESTSDSDGLGIEDIEDDDNDFDSSGEDWDSEDWDEAGMPILHPGPALHRCAWHLQVYRHSQYRRINPCSCLRHGRCMHKPCV